MRCKVGDLAYLVNKTGEYQPNEGRVFEVTRFHKNDPKYGCMWEVRSAMPLSAWSINGDELSARTVFQCPDDWLRPITGLPITDDVTDEVTA